MFARMERMGLSLVQGAGGEVEVVTDGPDARLCAAMGLLNAATAEVVAAIAEALVEGGWEGDGITSAEHWVALRCGVATARARRLVALARGLADLPAAAAAFLEGSLSEDQASLVCTHVDAAHDAEVTELARRSTVGQLRRVLPTVVAPPPPPMDAPEDEPPAGEDGDPGAGLGDVPGRRETAFGHAEDGRWWARVLLQADEGAVVEKALEASRDALFRDRGGAGSRAGVGWSDALVHMAEAALSNVEGTGRSPADRFQVVVHVDADAPDRARLHLGPFVPASVRSYLTCDATGRAVVERDGTPVHVFARRRTVDDRLRTLIEQRDGGCRVPGCGRQRWLHVHHLVHHEDGGLTVPGNLCCLCPAHHRLHHAGRLGIGGDPTTADGLAFTDHRGRPIRGPGPRPPGAAPPDVAGALGTHPRWEPPLGESIDPKWINWS